MHCLGGNARILAIEAAQCKVVGERLHYIGDNVRILAIETAQCKVVGERLHCVGDNARNLAIEAVQSKDVGERLHWRTAAPRGNQRNRGTSPASRNWYPCAGEPVTWVDHTVRAG